MYKKEIDASRLDRMLFNAMCNESGDPKQELKPQDLEFIELLLEQGATPETALQYAENSKPKKQVQEIIDKAKRK